MKVGIIGGGQLGRMLALAAVPLGIKVRVLEPADSAPAARVAEHIRAPYADRHALIEFVAGLDVVTYEFENVPAAATEFLSSRVPVRPGPRALAVSQDRLQEKAFFRDQGVPTPRFARVDSFEDLQRAVAEIGLPAILKTRRMGYDGKGQVAIAEETGVAAAWETLAGVPLILEERIPFERELSILTVRGADGQILFYPLVENRHREGILRRSVAPAPAASPELEHQAREIGRAVAEALDYVGLLAVELFERGGVLLANEMAPRVHNSGHWTVEGAETSQFENHLRAIAGLPLGITMPRGHSAMLNLIGELPDTRAVLTVPGAHLHLYEKEPRPARKLGHVTLRADLESELHDALNRLEPLVP